MVLVLIVAFVAIVVAAAGMVSLVMLPWRVEGVDVWKVVGGGWCVAGGRWVVDGR